MEDTRTEIKTCRKGHVYTVTWTWSNGYEYRDIDGCPECRKASSRRARKNRAAKDEILRGLGLKKVIGEVSGRTYWE